jgi:hypothetical protein
MFHQIEWVIFFRGQDQATADAFFHQVRAALQQDITILECERYWKDQTLFKARVTSPLGAPDLPQAVFATLCICARIAERWGIGAPRHYAGDRWRFAGGAVNDTVFLEGVVMLDFEIRNYEPVGYEASD